MINRSMQEMIQRCLSALDVYRGDFVLIGGLASMFYMYTEGYSPSPLEPSATKDMDLALGQQVPVRGATIAEQLRGEGFYRVPVHGLDHKVSKDIYQLDERKRVSPEHIEFLCPEGIQGKPQHDLKASALRYVKFLCYRPVLCDIPECGTIQLPHPLNYVIQKMKMRKERKVRNKHIKDQADIIFVIWSFHDNWEDWRRRCLEMRTVEGDWSKWIDRAFVDFDQLYISGDAALFEVLEHFAAMDIKINVDEIRLVVRDFLRAMGV